MHLHFPPSIPFWEVESRKSDPQIPLQTCHFLETKKFVHKYAEFNKKRQILRFANIQNVLFTGNVLTCAHNFGERVSQSLVFCQPHIYMKLEEGSPNGVGR